MTDSLDVNNFVLGLEENAMDSLIHAVEHFIYGEKDTDLKYVVLHVFHAIELFLKARLAKAGPELIYKKLRKDGTRGTVGLGELKSLLSKECVVLSEENNTNLELLQEVRNSIEHYRVAFNREEIEDYVGRAMYFLDRFLKKELNLNLKEQLDKINDETYQTLAKACVFYFKRMQEHGISLHPKEKYVSYDFDVCEVCGEETVIFPDPDSNDNTIHCFCCQSRYSVKHCSRCECSIFSLIGSGETVYQSINKDFDDDCGENCHMELCDACQEWINQQD